MEESRNADDMAGKELENLGAVPISYVSPMSSPYDAHVAMSAFMTPPYATGFPSLTQQPMFYSLNWHGPTVPPTAERPMHGAHGAHSQSFSTRGESSKPTPSTQRTREADLAADSPASARKTLFIAGFPPDVKEREIYNLLRFQPGFVDCSLIPSANGKQVRTSLWVLPPFPLPRSCSVCARVLVWVRSLCVPSRICSCPTEMPACLYFSPPRCLLSSRNHHPKSFRMSWRDLWVTLASLLARKQTGGASWLGGGDVQPARRLSPPTASSPTPFPYSLSLSI